MIEFVTKLLEITALLIKAWLAARSDARSSQFAVKLANQKLSEIAGILEFRMREENREAKSQIEPFQDRMDADLSGKD